MKKFYVDSYGQISKGSPWKKIDERQEAEIKEKIVSDARVRASKDMKLNFNKSFQTDDRNSEKASLFITDIKVVSGFQ